jgi:hypothetical protein
MTQSEMQLSVSVVVRELMKQAGKHLIFNNLYNTGTRTIKCYAARDGAGDGKLALSIRQTIEMIEQINQIKIPYKIRYTNSYRGRALIVKLFRS